MCSEINLCCVQAVLPNVESLETGVLDLEQWLSEGEQLLASHKLDGTADAAEARLEKHKVSLLQSLLAPPGM